MRMGDNRILKYVAYEELKTRNRSQHKPWKKFKDNLNTLYNDVLHWEELCTKWRHFMREVCDAFKDDCLRNAQIKHDLRREAFTLICYIICILVNVVCVCACHC